jgi:hypothetical protein
MVALNRNKNLPIVIFLGGFVLFFLLVNAIRHIRIYVVYNSGLGPFMVTAVIIFAIIILFLKGYK